MLISPPRSAKRRDLFLTLFEYWLHVCPLSRRLSIKRNYSQRSRSLAKDAPAPTATSSTRTRPRAIASWTASTALPRRCPARLASSTRTKCRAACGRLTRADCARTWRGTSSTTASFALTGTWPALWAGFCPIRPIRIRTTAPNSTSARTAWCRRKASASLAPFTARTALNVWIRRAFLDGKLSSFSNRFCPPPFLL